MIRARLNHWRKSLKERVGLTVPENHWSIPLKEKLGLTHTTSGLRRFGRPFLTTFPKTVLKGKKRSQFIICLSTGRHATPVSVSIMSERLDRKTGWQDRLAAADLEFRNGKVIIQNLQGEDNAQPLLERFREMHGETWANFLTRTIEEHARKAGYNQVLLVRPEKQQFFKTPLIRDTKLKIPRGLTADQARQFYKNWKKKRVKEVKQKMRALYHGVTEARGFRKGLNYFVKDL